MADITNNNNSLIIKVGETTYSFPANKVVLTEDNISNSVNVKLLGSRKTILNIPDTTMEDFK